MLHHRQVSNRSRSDEKKEDTFLTQKTTFIRQTPLLHVERIAMGPGDPGAQSD